MTILYHYTDTVGKNAIENCGYILQSTRHPFRDDAMYGNGVYLTSIPPTSSTRHIIGNNYDGPKYRYDLAPKTEWYFEFDSDYIEVDYVGQNNNRDVWLYRDEDLVITGKAGHRKV